MNDIKKDSIMEIDGDWEERLTKIFADGMGMTKEDFLIWMDKDSSEEDLARIRSKYDFE
ncbi:MAG TPA: hypothetical protein GX733_02210 [Tissierellia bacterium]|jgi:hypothetical protein|nr:hypothetical protein [Tissierellia bacterium]